LNKVIDFFRFRKIDYYVIKSYIGPFLLTFLISWFVLLMQFLWKYIDDMIGKGLDYIVIFKLIYFTALTTIPMALPLAILLSSIMSMGNFGEHFELTAAKASGISLFRFFKSLIIFSAFISIFAFYFANFVLTKVDIIAKSMLAEVRNLKPALLIKPKTFYNGISGITIRAESKDEEKGILNDLRIYDHTSGKGNENILLAKRGYLSQSEDGMVLIMRLDSGVLIKEDASSSLDNPKYPFYQTKFSSWEKRFDLKQFKLSDNFGKGGDDKRFMLPVSELNVYIDSFQKQMKSKKGVFVKNLNAGTYIAQSMSTPKYIHFKDSLSRLTPDEKKMMSFTTSLKARNVKNMLFLHNSDYEYIKSLKNLYSIEWHFKYTFALSCLILFFVGAPLGAIIKKGGLGWPMLFSVILFILFYFSNLIAKKVSEIGKIEPVIVMWTPTVFFMALGFFLTIKAKNDSNLLNIESYNLFFNNLKKRFQKKNK
jgi:lipopolysaccharide export system permease protein